MKKAITILISCLLLLVSISANALDVFSPKNNGLVIGDTAKIIIRCSEYPEIKGRIGGDVYELSWTQELYGNRWISHLKLPGKGEYTLFLGGQCAGSNDSGKVRFSNAMESPVEIADLVIARFFSISKYYAENMDWNWELGTGNILVSPFEDRSQVCEKR